MNLITASIVIGCVAIGAGRSSGIAAAWQPLQNASKVDETSLVRQST